MEKKYTMLKVKDISYDVDNPRIKMSLEKYRDQIDAERIHFALRSATEGTQGVSSYNSLKDSILASKGAQYPITVVRKGESYICIDGNTRLAIYKQLAKEQAEGDWREIDVVLLKNTSPRDIETIRVSAHLIGAREWPAYEKARYLHYLRHTQFMDYSEMIALCGGNKTSIERQIDAYHDMNEHYRDKVDDAAFHIDRYSGFVELQKPRIKEAIFDAGLSLDDFGEWIRDGKIFRLESVRLLPKILADDEARKVFLDGGPRSIEEADTVLKQRAAWDAERTDAAVTLAKATLSQLAAHLAQRIDNLPYSEMRMLRDKERQEVVEQVSVLEDLSMRLQRLLDDVSE